MKRIISLSAVAGGVLALTGCVSPHMFDKPTELREQTAALAKSRATVPAIEAQQPRVIETAAPYIPLTPRKVSDSPWLKRQVVDVKVGDNPVPLAEVLRIMSRQGITITSELALDRFTYSGFSMNQVDAETALRAILSSVGLDYSVDNAHRVVVIKPLAARTWYLNIGNRRSSYASGTSETNSASGGSNAFGAEKGGGTSQSSGTSTVSSADDFWASLRTELEDRMQVLVPEPPKVENNTGSAAAAAAAAMAAQTALSLPPLVPPGMSAGQVPPTPGSKTNSQGALQVQMAPVAGTMMMPPIPQQTVTGSDGVTFVSKKVGNYSLNPETGAISVQAPHWVLTELDTYFQRIQSMYNTDIVFSGELVMLTTDKQRSEGLDISAFARFANSKYGLAFANNALGGVTLSFPGNGNNIPSLTAGAGGGLAGPLVGLVSPSDGLSLFNSYLSNIGNVTSLQKPVLTTTSGVPADFRRTVTRYFNTVSQETASGGTGNAAVGTTNTLVAQDFGTILRVNPRIDVATGLIRAQIELVQTSQTGTQNLPQVVSSGDGVSQITTSLPVVSKIIYSGEALLRDGDLIVMGGQTEDVESGNRDGITGLMDNSAVGGLFGVTKTKAERNVFYFALRVSVTKR